MRMDWGTDRKERVGRAGGDGRERGRSKGRLSPPPSPSFLSLQETARPDPRPHRPLLSQLLAHPRPFSRPAKPPGPSPMPVPGRTRPRPVPPLPSREEPTTPSSPAGRSDEA